MAKNIEIIQTKCYHKTKKPVIFLEKDNEYLPFCDGSSLKNRDIRISLSPEIAFRIELLAKKENKTLEEYLSELIFRESEKAFPSNKGFYKKYFR